MPPDAPVAMRGLPILVIVTLVGVVSNVSAVSRLRAMMALLSATSFMTVGVRERRSATQELDPVPVPANDLTAAETRGVA